ncbi:DUF1351 domain-containing protein [Pediococcus acidilactici]|jgi:hypothetical protein|uniref:DUF1351 domain-containing protein n=1 Tax=Pediococcus acidilactici TaxID=1254 RepID=UPI000FF8F2B0|nr:DUF1351 domain-containing protein [Pediococcus acidilactici]KAF0372783.1 DUF1351 domain-containing protein [Pediococcus acidilactici]KAF0383346.1 DUF1351 domain-containing protein [Pediococcus acidilactici]KAF0457392.1 DUF1351 domain-containing protein [Pediococcus acidilactici]KAF0476474.1 DUF1351 domain-containing protein [Pediococcus acidilactici]KAF0536995.1 DUF1351 domain-containing protein [Pediococcus acidilactici]
MTNAIADVSSHVEFKPAELKLTNRDAIMDRAKEIRDQFKMDNPVITTENLAGNKLVLRDLKKQKKLLDEARLKVKREYNKPLDEFTSDIKKAQSIIDEAINPLEIAVNDVEEKQKQERKQRIMDVATQIFEQYEVDINDLEFDKHWLNKTYQKTKRENEIIAQAVELRKQKDQLAKDAEAVNNLAGGRNLDPEPFIQQLQNGIPLADVTQNIDAAAKQAEQRKEQQERLEIARKAQEQAELEAKTKKVGNKRVDKTTGEVVDEYRTFRFTAKVNIKQAKALVEFLKNNGIEYETEAV